MTLSRPRVTSLEARFEKTENHVEILKENKNVNRGRDRVIYIILGAVGMMMLSLAAIYLKK